MRTVSEILDSYRRHVRELEKYKRKLGTRGNLARARLALERAVSEFTELMRACTENRDECKWL